jgi:O-antigen ligase
MSGPTARAAIAAPRVAVLLALFAGPLLSGAVHPFVYVPLLAVFGFAGLLAWRLGGGLSGPLPGARLLLALHALVLLQLVPLPRLLLRFLSPGSLAYWSTTELVPGGARPISVSPSDTLRGFAFLAALSLLALFVWREMAAPPWPRRLAKTVALAGLGITVVAFVQAVSSHPHRIWGLVRPAWDWAVFGPYVNRNHFSGYLVMATPVAIGFALEALSRFAGRWRHRRRAFLALGDPEAASALGWCAIVMTLVAGLLAAASRGAVSAFIATLFLLPLAARHRRRTAAAVLLLAALGFVWVGLGGFLGGFSRGIKASRLDLWVDMLPIAARFPALGAGFNAFSVVYPWYQTVWRGHWIGQAHNEYLQALLETGILGAVLFGTLFAIVIRRAAVRARSGPVDLGVFGAVVGLALHNVVDFNWQIPANAAAWVALAALAVRPVERKGDDAARARHHERWKGRPHREKDAKVTAVLESPAAGPIELRRT